MQTKEQRRLYYLNNKEKINAKSRENYLKNRESIIAKSTEWAKNNPDKVKVKNERWVKNNRERKNEISREFTERNPSYYVKYTAEYRALKYSGTLESLSQEDHNVMRNLYVLAKQLENNDGIKRHVDHIIPLRGKNVCGLHVPWNLQILTAEENLKKNNKV